MYRGLIPLVSRSTASLVQGCTTCDLPSNQLHEMPLHLARVCERNLLHTLCHADSEYALTASVRFDRDCAMRKA